MYKEQKKLNFDNSKNVFFYKIVLTTLIYTP